MSNIASKNLYELLGNDPELDPDREPAPPTKAIDKPVARSGKRNAGPEPPAAPAGESRSQGGRRGGRGDGLGGNEAAFRGNYNNRGRNNVDDVARQERSESGSNYRGRGRGRGGRGGRGGFGAPRDDRHSKTGISEHDKQAAHGWGGQTGADEWDDEKAGEAIAKEEQKDGFDTSVPPPVNGDGETLKDGEASPAAEPEPEDKSQSYADYLAEQLQKKASLGLGALEARKPNEGSSKKFPEGKAITREEEDDFIAGAGGKASRVREKKQKEVVQLDDERLHKAPDMGGRGGRGRGRGDGSFRGGDRGDRGDRRGGRGRGGDGERRGGFRGDGDRPRGRGGRGGSGANLNPNDQTAFPSLGS